MPRWLIDISTLRRAIRVMTYCVVLISVAIMVLSPVLWGTAFLSGLVMPS